jgi:hypothetical protein
MRAALAFLILASAASSDMWGSWHAKRVADPYGRHYVVLRYHDGSNSARYTFAEIGPDAPPAESEEYEEYENWKDWSIGGGLREGDRIVSRGSLETPSYDVIVSATGMGFVGVEEWWHFGHGNAVTIVPADGGAKITRTLVELLTPREIDAFPRSTSSIWWLRGAWLDDAARKVVLVSRAGHLRTVGWDDGSVAEGTDADVVRALALPYPAARTLALELASERRIGAAKGAAAALLEDRSEPLPIRLRAAVALASIGDLRGKDLVVRSADAERALAEDPAAEYAVAHLPSVLGEKAIPLLAELLREGVAEAMWGFYALGHRAVPALTALVREGQADAASVLLWLGTRQAVPALLGAICAEDRWLAQAAAKAAIELSGDEIAPELTETLRRGTKAPHAVATFFREVRWPEAVPLLLDALEDPPEDVREWDLEKIVAALAFQTGKDFGLDTGAWRMWLDTQKK